MNKTNSASTEEFVEIEDVRDTLVIMKNGSCRSIVEMEAVNFDLKSQDEQTGILRGFQDFFNAVDFPIQIAVHSKKLDIGGYLRLVDETGQKLANDLLKMQMAEYAKFVKGLAELTDIMEKRFFVIVSYYAVEAARTGESGLAGMFKGLFRAVKPATATISDERLVELKNGVEQRLALIIASLSPLGLKATILDREKLLALLPDYYAPRN